MLEKYRNIVVEAQTKREKLVLEKLPYERNALEPVMSKETIDLHYGVLSKGYVDRYNNKEGDDKFNYGGAVLHNLYWASLQPPKGNNKPHGASEELINKKYGSFTEFKNEFMASAKSIQGSGWAYMDTKGDIHTIANQDFIPGTKIAFLTDMWEHAYLLDSNKDKYLDSIWRIVNWSTVNDRLQGE